MRSWITSTLGITGRTGNGRRAGSSASEGTRYEAESELTLEEVATGTTRLLEVDGRRIQVDIPAGVADGQRIRFSDPARFSTEVNPINVAKHQRRAHDVLGPIARDHWEEKASRVTRYGDQRRIPPLGPRKSDEAAAKVVEGIRSEAPVGDRAFRSHYSDWRRLPTPPRVVVGPELHHVGDERLFRKVINGGFGIVVALGLWLIGLPYAFLWGFLAGCLRFIPYVGTWMAAALPIALSLAVFDGWQKPILVVGLFVVLEPLIYMVLEPLVYGHSAGLAPIAVIAAALFWTWLWGPVGLLLATPLTVCLAVMGRYIPEMGYLNVQSPRGQRNQLDFAQEIGRGGGADLDFALLQTRLSAATIGPNRAALWHHRHN